jgi:hypothetical protein
MGKIDQFTLDAITSLAVLDDVPLVTQFQPNRGGEEQFFHSRKHQRILSGANNSGKTYSGVVEGAYHSIPEIDELGNPTGYTIHPYNRIKVDPEGIMGWISSYSQDVQFDTIQPVFDRIFGPYLTNKYAEEGVLHWAETDKARINFKWQTQGWESYRGPKLNWIHLDEPHSEAVYNECVSRLFNKQGYLWITMTPVVDLQKAPTRIRDVIWMIKRLVEPYFRNPRKFPELEIIFIDLEENAAWVNTTFVRNMLAGVSEDEYVIRTTGRFIIMIGISAFSEMRLDKLQLYQKEHYEECVPQYGYLHYNSDKSDDAEEVFFEPSEFDSYPDHPDEGFIFRIWQHPIKEQLGVRPQYHIGVDMAEGKKDSDYTCGRVKRQDSRQLVAELHGRMDEVEAARQLNLLGRYYSNPNGDPAKVAIEVNGIGKTTLSYMLNGNSDVDVKQYPAISLYQRPTLDNLNMGIHIPSKDYGWYTTTRHRQHLLTAMRSCLSVCISNIESKGVCIIPDSGWVSEARTFVKDNRGKYTAPMGFYDDRLLADALADLSIQQGIFSTPVYRTGPVPKMEASPAFIDDPNDPKGMTTIIDMAELRRRARERKSAGERAVRAVNEMYP